jgi:iron complex transport system substrate-binding protein
LSLSAALALAASCSQRQAPTSREAVRTVRDGMGSELRLPATVRRVVSLAPSTTEVIFAVGAGPLVVGADRYSDFPAEAARVEKVGQDMDPSLERIVALRPDLVFAATTANSQRNVEALERTGIPVYVSHADGLDAIFDDVERIADALGRREAGRALAASLRARRDAVVARTSHLGRVRAVVVVWTDPLLVAGPHSQVDELLRDAGGDNVAGDAAPGYPAYSIERLLARAPDVVIAGTHANGENDPTRMLADRLGALPAVRRGKVIALDGDLMFRPGPRIVDGLEKLARELHP